MAEKKKCLLSWSSGKDCAYALHLLRRSAELEVVGLLTSVNETFDRVAMHAVRRTLLEEQADACGLPLHVIELPWPCSNDIYESRMRSAVTDAEGAGVQAIAFGDLFLEDIRRYRERQLAETKLVPVFPLWGRETRQLAAEMVEAGVKARITSVDPKQLDPSFVGRRWDAALLEELPEQIDPCGENGEFHTFVHDGPMFRHPIPIEVAKVVERDGFFFADILPGRSV